MKAKETKGVSKESDSQEETQKEAGEEGQIKEETTKKPKRERAKKGQEVEVKSRRGEAKRGEESEAPKASKSQEKIALSVAQSERKGAQLGVEKEGKVISGYQRASRSADFSSQPLIALISEIGMLSSFSFFLQVRQNGSGETGLLLGLKQKKVEEGKFLLLRWFGDAPYSSDYEIREQGVLEDFSLLLRIVKSLPKTTISLLFVEKEEAQVLRLKAAQGITYDLKFPQAKEEELASFDSLIEKWQSNEDLASVEAGEDLKRKLFRFCANREELSFLLGVGGTIANDGKSLNSQGIFLQAKSLLHPVLPKKSLVYGIATDGHCLSLRGASLRDWPESGLRLSKQSAFRISRLLSSLDEEEIQLEVSAEDLSLHGKELQIEVSLFGETKYVDVWSLLMKLKFEYSSEIQKETFLQQIQSILLAGDREKPFLQVSVKREGFRLTSWSSDKQSKGDFKAQFRRLSSSMPGEAEAQSEEGKEAYVSQEEEFSSESLPSSLSSQGKEPVQESFLNTEGTSFDASKVDSIGGQAVMVLDATFWKVGLHAMAAERMLLFFASDEKKPHLWLSLPSRKEGSKKEESQEIESRVEVLIVMPMNSFRPESDFFHR